MQMVLLSCLKATELIEKKYYFNLSVVEKLQLGAHKIICKPCNQYDKHSKIIEHGIADFKKNIHSNPDIVKFKKKIINKLEEMNM